MFDFLYDYGYVIAIAVLLLEFYLAWRWTPQYCRSGIPLYYRKYELEPRVWGKFDPELLERRCQGRLIPSMLFRIIGPNECAFREKLLQFRLPYPPLMHGTVNLDLRHDRVVAVGRLNWAPVALLVWLIIVFADERTEFDIRQPFLVWVVFVSLYLIQFRRFNKVVKTACLATAGDLQLKEYD